MSCHYCNIEGDRIIFESKLAFAVYPGYSVSEHHSLIIPKRHAETYFDLTEAERNACHGLLVKMRGWIATKDRLVDGYNITINNGESAGQIISHCHMHLIPRRTGDVKMHLNVGAA